MGFLYNNNDNFESTTSTFRPPRPNRRAEETMRHVTRGWIPANPTTLKKIHHLIKEANLNTKREEIIEAIKNDPALFAHCAKNILKVAELNIHGNDLLETLKQIEDEKLRSLLNVSERELSTHKLRDATKLQALRFQHSILSTHSAESLAAKAHLSAELAFSASYFQQLGFSLIAWNYPRIYQQVVTRSRKDGDDLDTQFKNFLGLTATELGNKFAAEWGVSHELRTTITSLSTNAVNTTPEQVGDIPSIVRLGELFAQSKDPIHFPTSHKKWDECLKIYETHYGHCSLEKVETEAHAIFSEMQNFVSSIAPLGKEESLSNANHEILTQMAQNDHLKLCTEEVQRLFYGVYERIKPGVTSPEAIKYLVDQVIPTLGFMRGCLYLVSKRTGILMPTLRIGESGLDSYYQHLEDYESGVPTTLESHIPYKGIGKSVTEKIVTHVSGSLEHIHHPGILYLEIDELRLEEIEDKAILYFHVIRKALNDSMA